MAKTITPTLSTIEVKKPTSLRFIDKNVKISPRKLRLLANDIKKLTPAVALVNLKFVNSLSGRILLKSVKTAVGVAKNNLGATVDNLVFDSIQVNEGLKIKRMDKSHGSRFNRGLIQKRHSRLTITIKSLNQNPSSSPLHEGEKPEGRRV